MTHLLVRNIFPEMLESLLPCLGVQVNRINQRPVNIEDDSLNHDDSL
jgi:hypothetical protein